MEQESQQTPELRITPEVAAAIVADKCRKDGEFAKKLNDDPKAALAGINKQQVPDEVKFVVHQNSADHWHIVIPSDAQASRLGKAFKMMDDAGGDTLNDEQLQAISGGVEVIWTIIFVGSMAGIAAGVTGGIVAGGVAAS